LIIAFLLFASGWIASEEFCSFGFGEKAELPSLAINSVLILSPLAVKVKEGVFFDVRGSVPLRVIVPDFESEAAGGVGESPFEVGFSGFGLALFDGLDLRGERCFEGRLAGGGEKF